MDCMATIASLLTISSPISLSFQSSFHLSLTVLVRYRSLAVIYLALDVIYHPARPSLLQRRGKCVLELHSQTTRLSECVWSGRDTWSPCSIFVPQPHIYGTVTLSRVAFQHTWAVAVSLCIHPNHSAFHTSADYNSAQLLTH